MDSFIDITFGLVIGAVATQDKNQEVIENVQTEDSEEEKLPASKAAFERGVNLKA